MLTEPTAETVALGRAGEEILRCEQLVIGHRGQRLLPPIDLSVRRGQMLAVLGRNGAGKTTFFRTLLGFHPAIGGAIHRPDPPPRLAYMGQASTIDPVVPVRGREVAGWGTLHGWSFLGLRRGRAVRAEAAAALEAASAAELGGAFVRDLSEGQRQRVLLARLLAARADIAFLDEPTAAMDAVAEERAMALLQRHCRVRGMAVVIITHLMAVARRYADQVLYLDRDDGVAAVGTPAEVFAHPTFHRQYGEIG